MDQVAEEGWITDDDSADEFMESASLENNLPLEDGNTNMVQAPMDHHESQRPFLLIHSEHDLIWMHYYRKQMCQDIMRDQ